MNKGSTARATMEPHLLLHRDDTAFVHFQYEPLAGSSIEVGEKVVLHDVPGTQNGWVRIEELRALEEWIPEIREHFIGALSRDAFASINSSWSPRGWPTYDNLQRLNAVWVDCDCEDLDYVEATDLLQQAQASGIIPPLSIIQRSGRGVWAFWLLRGAEDDLDLPPRAFASNRELATRINLCLGERLAEAYPALNPDLGARWATFHHRVAGSINSKTGLTVEFTISLTDQGHLPRYGLKELQTLLDLPTRLMSQSATPASERARQPQKGAGRRARHEKPLDELQLLRAHRGGFGKGHRRKACQLLASLALGSDWPEAAVEREVLRLARECDPPLPRWEAVQQVRSAVRRARRPRNRTIAQALEVTPQEIGLLGLTKLRPDFSAQEASRTGQRAVNRVAREALLTEVASKHGSPLPFTFSDLEELLRPAGRPSRGVIQTDLKRLKLRVVRARGKSTSAGQRSLL